MMAILSTFFIFISTILLLVYFRQSNKPFAYSWSTATVGAILSIIAISLWKLALPYQSPMMIWPKDALIKIPIVFAIDEFSWVFSLSFAVLLSVVMLTAPMRSHTSLQPASWIANVAVTGLGILALNSANVFTLSLAWTLLDLVELINLLRLSNSPISTRRGINSFAFKFFGTMSLVVALLYAKNSDLTTSFEFINNSTTAIFMIIAAGLRLGIMPLHIALPKDPIQRRGFGTIIRLITASTSIAVLSKLPHTPIQNSFVLWSLPVIAIAGLFAAWVWLTTKDDLSGRPFFIISVGAMALTAAISGNTLGVVAWGVCLILIGSISFLYSAREKRISVILGITSIFLLGLPFTITANSWAVPLLWPFLYLPVFMLIQLLVVLGFIRHLFEEGDSQFELQPNWARSFFLIGLSFAPITLLLFGIVGWEGAMNVGNWIYSLALLSVSGTILFASLRYKAVLSNLLNIDLNPVLSRFYELTEVIISIIRRLGDVFIFVFSILSLIFEGEGGLLWIGLFIIMLLVATKGFGL